MADAVLALNAGSSTVKFALFDLAKEAPALRYRGLIEGLGRRPRVSVWSGLGLPVEGWDWPDVDPDPETVALAILDWAQARLGGDRLRAFSHRIVHGGVDFAAPVLATPDVLARLEALCGLAPLHQPHNLAMLRAMQQARPGLPQAACFDTGFFHDLPAPAQDLALPRAWRERGVRRYGFHGLSYSYLQRRLVELDPAAAGGRAVFAHLGSGASLCATLSGAPLDTTMGFSALDGLVMASRCGALDPGVILFLMQSGGLTVGEVEDLLYRRSGLLGVSGLSGDMRTLLASDAPEAALAVEVFLFRLVRELGGQAAALGGLDTLVFSGGIGEHSAEIRRRVCGRLAWLGVELDPAANQAGAVKISASDSAVSVWVVATDEERVLAEAVARLLIPD